MNRIIEEDIKTIIDQSWISLKKLEGKSILISGGCGFLGSWFVAVLHKLNQAHFHKPCKVYVVDSFIAADKRNSLTEINSEHIMFIESDISIMKIHGKMDYIIHAAGIASPIFYRKYPIETIDGMVLGLSNLFKFVVKNPVKGMLVFSSSERYGNPHADAVPMKEDYNGNVSPTGPRSCYDESKRMEEAMCAAYHRVHNVPVKWVMPFNIYGPGMRINDDRVVPKFIFQMLRNDPITVHRPAKQTRTFCYITDAMAGFFQAMIDGKNGEPYNIGRQEEEIGIELLALKMKRLIDTKSEIVTIEMPEEYPTDQAQRRCPDISKAKNDFGYSPKVSLEQGLIRTYGWCKELFYEQKS